MSPTNHFDQKIIAALTENARLPITELAKVVGLSRTAVQHRVKRLERDDVITGYTLKQPIDKALSETGSYILISLVERVQSKEVVELLLAFPEVQQCHQISGETDLIVTLEMASQNRVQEICQKLWQNENVKETNTLFVLGSKTP